MNQNECGDCHACCVVLPVYDRPTGWAKAGAEPCEHLRPGESGCCGIYQRRPEVCRAWHCAWRKDPWLGSRPDYRPDRLGVMFSFSGAGLGLWEVRRGALQDGRVQYIKRKLLAMNKAEQERVTNYPVGAVTCTPVNGRYPLSVIDECAQISDRERVAVRVSD